ncbi:MAG: BatA and WFA domain-containing protein [Saprospiraceae bacterium]|nr:BatA and WFA domain-containing protein [Saprospiraceae bacterium]
MHFLYPGFLWSLLALAIPVIIHLFYFRRFKRVYFTNVRFLKEIKEETSSRNKLKNLLILAMRLLAVACLVFAFAQPFIPTGQQVKLGEKAVSIFIDNSFSMAAEKENIPLLDLAKDRAEKIVNAYGEDTRFQIITHDFEGRHQRLVSKDEALAMIEEIVISPAVQPLSKVINRQRQVLKGDHHLIFLISDFQKSITDLKPWTDSLTCKR